MTYEYIVPTAVLYADGGIRNAECLLTAREKQILLQEDVLCRVSGGGYLVLDFGQEYRGGVRILTHEASAGYTVRLRFGESVAECFAELGQQGACNDHSERDFSLLLPSYSDTVRASSGFRFLRIDFPAEGTVAIKNVYLAYEHYETAEPAPFQTRNELHRRIFETARRTIDLCTGEYVWDGIKRDRLVWMGDMHPEMLALTALYGKSPAMERSIDLMIRRDAPLGRWMNTFPTYSVWGLIVLSDYARRVDAYDFAAQYRDYILGLVEQIDATVSDDGEIHLPFYFFDWPTHESEAELHGCRALMLWMTNAVRPLFEHFAMSTTALERLADKLKKIKICAMGAKQVAAIKYLATGTLTDEERTLLCSGGAHGLSTFMSYYILKAVALIDSPTRAIAMMEEYFGGMLALGATTFFEDFDLDWAQGASPIDRLPRTGESDFHADNGAYCYKGFRHSLCHGWSAGVIEFMYKYCNECK